MHQGKIVIVTSGFPRRSETFALHELLALEERGLLAAVFATKPGDGASPQPGGERLLGRVQVLSGRNPAEQAAEVVGRLGARAVSGVHGYFAHTPAEVAAAAAERLGVPYGFSVHARDAHKVAPDQLAERAGGAACVVACNPDVAQEISRDGARVQVMPHGVDLARFRPPASPPAAPLRLLAVGRLVEKKGFDVLVAAAARLSFPFRLRIVGDGPERARLAALIAAARLEGRVVLCGARSHAELPQEYADANVVIAPSVVDAMGDRDGLPNVILEAMASGRPVVASEVGAIRSAITDGETGRLVPASDAVALASALEGLAQSPALRSRLGRAARERVERDYEIGRCTERLCRLLTDVYA